MDPQLPFIKQIIGPMNLSVIWVNGRLLMLFGDHHIPNESVCDIPGSILLRDFLDQLFKTFPVCTDFFLELNYFQNLPTPVPSLYPKFKRSPRHELEAVMEKYQSCFLANENKCPYSNVRFHNIDLRLTPIRWYDYNNIYYFKYITSNDQLDRMWEQRSLFRDILVALLDGNLHLVSDLFLDLYADIPDLLLAYQYQNLIHYSPYPIILKQLKDNPFRVQIKNSILKQFDEDIESILKFDSVDNMLFRYHFDFGKSLMDIYALGKMTNVIFKDENSRLIIVYAGDGHIRSYRKFLIGQGFIDHLFIESRRRRTTCIPLSSEKNQILYRDLKSLDLGPCHKKSNPSTQIAMVSDSISISNLDAITVKDMASQRIIGLVINNLANPKCIPLNEYIAEYLSIIDTPTLFLISAANYPKSLNRFRLCFDNGECNRYPMVRFESVYLSYLPPGRLQEIAQREFTIPNTSRLKFVEISPIFMRAIFDHDTITLENIFFKYFRVDSTEILSLPLYSEIPKLWQHISPEIKDRISIYLMRALQRNSTEMMHFGISLTRILSTLDRFLNNIYMLGLSFTDPRYSNILLSLDFTSLLDLLPGTTTLNRNNIHYDPYYDLSCVKIPWREQELFFPFH